MAFSLISSQTVQGVTSGTTSAIDTTGADFLAIWLGAFAQSGVTVSDSKTNTWNGLTAITGGDACEGRWFYATNVSGKVGSGHTFSFSGGGSNFVTLVILAFSGAHTTVPYAGQIASAVGAPASSTVQGGSLTPATANSLWLTGCSPNDASSGVPTIDSGFATPIGAAFSGGVAEGGAVSYLETSSAQNPAWSWTGFPGKGVASGIIIEPAGSPPAGPVHQFRMLLGAG